MFKVAHDIHMENPNLYKLLLIATKYEQDEVAASYHLGATIIYSLLTEAAKPNKLPVVSDDTVKSTIASFFGDNPEKKSQEVYSRMLTTDKTLLMCIAYIVDCETLQEEEKNWMCKAFAQFYDLLRRQQEAMDMEELYG
jgi:hypothetical protein